MKWIPARQSFLSNIREDMGVKCVQFFAILEETKKICKMVCPFQLREVFHPVSQ
jgi:hypothetical protein